MQLKKISDYEWEIPIEDGMLVPGRVFASAKLLEKMKEDKCLEQVKNVAKLPGILKASLAMPDAHQGYGFCIGGVAAFDAEEGVISPGGVGYDINCLSGKTKILTELGYYKKIEDFENNYKNNSLNILDKENKTKENSSISLFLKKNSPKIIKIKTKSGKEIFATGEHPFYTKNGMKEINKIKSGDDVLIYPFEGVEYENPGKILLIEEKDIDNLDRSITSKLQIKKKLKELDLLPLDSDNPKIGHLIKIMGFVFGDGSLNLGKNLQIGFYGEKEDLSEIKRDLEKIGFLSHLFSRKRKHKIKTEYKEYEFTRDETSLHCNSSALANLLFLLGTPMGNKAEKDYPIPKWIMDSVKWHKRLFLSSLFGAELSSPKTLTNNKFNLYCPIFSMSKRNSLHGLNFANQISKLLEDFNVRSILVKSRTSEVNGTKSTRIRLMIYSDSENLINLYSKINYEFNIKKRKLANAAILWLKQKEKILKFREETIQKAREMKQNGLVKSEIINSLSDKYANKYFIDKAIYCQNYAKSGTRIAFCFESFNEFLIRNSFGEQGFVWDEIESKEELDYNDKVYDFTTDNENHNFIAGNFVVSNCSVRLLATNLTRSDLVGKEKEILHSLFRTIPSGVGRESRFKISRAELNDVLLNGAQWAVGKGFGTKEDYLHTEENGKMENADPKKVSEKAKSRGLPQLGTLGAGNHFLELQVVEEILDENIAKVFGLKKDQVTIMIHCGSRGLGHQVASDYIKLMDDKYGHPAFDRELVYAPITSDLGKAYFSAMSASANFAFANKQMITHWIREDLKKYFPSFEAKVVYDVCHNIAKFETHIIDGKEKKVLIMRKGATRSFPPGSKEIPSDYLKVGQPVLIPGSMGTNSYVLCGTKTAEEKTFSSTAHGAGRLMSRTASKKELTLADAKNELAKKEIEIESGSIKGILEEMPSAYKDIDEVVSVSENSGIGKIVAKLKPFAVMKG